MTDLHAAAVKYLEAGLSVLPAIVETKFVPPKMSWKPFQTRVPTPAEFRAWFANQPDGVCIVAGNVSNRLEVIDHDAAGEMFELLSEMVEREVSA